MSNFENVDANRLPYGNCSFSDIRAKDNIYVDKTALIAQIASQDVPIFFSRPRRFGKSLLINTLSSLFSNGLEYFHGLDIEKIWKDKTYQVVHLDFSGIAENNAEELKEDLGEMIIEKFRMKGIVFQRGESGIRRPSRILDEISEKLKDNSIVLLIDEYDAPLTHHLNQPEELSSITKILNNFYATIKQYSGKFRLIFITGVTRTSRVSIFSAFNNLLDLSLREEFNSILGFTQDELSKYFDPYIEKAAKVLKMSKNDVYACIKHHYDGFKFSLESEQTLYNPWSLLNFFSNPKLGFKNYWFDSGGTPSIIMQYLKIDESFDFLDYNKRYLLLDIDKLSSKYEITNIPREILLYQAGYFTICGEQDGMALLVLPNVEVEESLLKLYLQENNLEPSLELRQIIKDISKAIDSKNLIIIVDLFNSILNECISSASNTFDDERSVRDIIYTALISIPSVQQIKERDTAKGKSDLELITAKTCMVIEFKRTYSTRGPEASLQKAIEQIKKNRYGLLFSKTRYLYRVAMVISTEEKKILLDYCQEID